MSELEIDGLTLIQGIEKIQDNNLFKGLSFEETRLLAGICELVSFGDGALIIEENAIGEDLYLIVKGEVRVIKGEGKAATALAVLQAGDIFGEMSLIDNVFTSSSVVSQGDTRLLRMKKRNLEQLMEDNVPIAVKIYRSFCMVLTDRLRKANERIQQAERNG